MDQAKLDKCRQQWQVKAAYNDYHDMLKKERIDILSVCTRSKMHLPIIEEALKYDLQAIYCEKPIAASLQEADRVIKLCKNKGVILVINHQRRFNPFYRALSRAIKNGDFGRIQTAVFNYTRGLANTGSHAFDLLNYMIGEPAWVTAAFSAVAAPDPNDPNYDGLIKYKNGAVAVLQACDDNNYLIFELDLLAEKGRFRLGKEQEYYQPVGSKNLLDKNELVKQAKWPLKVKPSPLNLLTGIDHLINCIEGKEKPLSTGQDGRLALELISAFHQSAVNKGKRVTLPLKIRNVEIGSR